ncbi:hypothetical protein Ocin01_06004 [Orchesella cincta]|uniref:Transmembrane protein n=1 Tax=Orchesella cincta TaxID=48709 RepID=A0A1D2N5Z7_ORCCI|nr:hypothetical protein Ocin01_06004 [Orchesella cincta]
MMAILSGESDPKAPLAENEDEEFLGDPVPSNIQAWTALGGIVAGVMLIMGLTSSEWVYAVDDFYYQGLFIYCVRGGFNDTYSGELDDDLVEEGCKRIDLENQGYTLFVAFLCSTALATVIFSTMLALLGSWVQDIDSKRKVYRLSLYLMIFSIIANFLSLLTYSLNFDGVVEEESLGPFEEPGDDWKLGWSLEICIAALIFQILTGLSIGYGLLLFPIEETVEDEEGGAAAAEK